MASLILPRAAALKDLAKQLKLLPKERRPEAAEAAINWVFADNRHLGGPSIEMLVHPHYYALYLTADLRRRIRLLPLQCDKGEIIVTRALDETVVTIES